MAKLIEKNGSELFASLVNIAAPINSLVKDEVLFQKFVDCTARGKDQPDHIRKTALGFIMNVYGEMMPLLFGEKHVKDIMTILAEIEGKPVKEMLAMNGADLLADAIHAWKEQISPFVERSGLTELIGSLLG